MRKILMVIALLGALTAGGAIAAPAASACSIASGAVYRPAPGHNLDQHFVVTGCSPNIDMISFDDSGFIDNGVYRHNTTFSINQTGFECSWVCIIPETAGDAATLGYWGHQTCWYAGTSHVLINKLFWRYRLNTGVWSSTQQYSSPPYVFAC